MSLKSTSFIQSGDLVNEAGANLNVLGDIQISAGNFTNAGALVVPRRFASRLPLLKANNIINSGTISNSYVFTMASDTFVNTGTINTSAVFSIVSRLTNTGIINVNLGSTVINNLNTNGLPVTSDIVAGTFNVADGTQLSFRQGTIRLSATSIIKTGLGSGTVYFAPGVVVINAPTNPVILVGLNGVAFNSTVNKVMTLTATTVMGIPLVNADEYVALQLPDGTLLVMQPDGSFSSAVTPMAANISVPDFTGSIFSYTFTGAEPVGTYTWFAALMQPGTMNVIGTMATSSFTFAP